jgi:uncharacterized protein YdaU (DUF1376 family)
LAKRPLNITIFPEDWARPIAVLSKSELGVWFSLSVLSWNETPPCTLPDSDADLAILAGVSADDWDRMRARIRLLLGSPVSGRFQTWLIRRFEEQQRFRAKKADAGSRGGKSAQALLKHCSSIAQATLDPPVPVPIHVHDLRRPNPKDTPLPPAETGGKGVCAETPAGIPHDWIESGVWRRDVAARAIAAAYPNAKAPGHSGPKVVATWLQNAGMSDPRFTGIWGEADAARWLLGRVKAFAASQWVRSTADGSVPMLRTWLDEARYELDDSAWAGSNSRSTPARPKLESFAEGRPL